MSERTTTSNGHEIAQTAPQITAEELRLKLAAEYGLDGNTAGQRIDQLKQLSNEGIAIMLEDINKSLQGSADSLMSHDRTIMVGERQTIPLEDRYQVFNRLVEDIRAAPPDTNPARVGDVLALGVVLLHPFHDGNGRTARTLGLLFRDEYDSDQYEIDFSVVIEPRDAARARGGFMVNGYIPRLPEGVDQSDPTAISDYLAGLLTEDAPGSYTGCYGQAPLHT